MKVAHYSSLFVLRFYGASFLRNLFQRIFAEVLGTAYSINTGGRSGHRTTFQVFGSGGGVCFESVQESVHEG
jgi:hypothetical protein